MQTIPMPDPRGPNVFVVSEEAHFELCKMRAHLRLMTRILDPNAVGLQDCNLHPHTLAWWFTSIWKSLDEYLQATHWSGDQSLDVEEAHRRAAEIRERNDALRGFDAT